MGAKFRQPPFSVAEANIISKSITANGTYNASSDNADGYNPVTVNVPESVIVSKSITANGTYNASSDNANGYNPVTVNVPESVIVNKSITANGTYNASSDNANGYNPVTVNVPMAYSDYIGKYSGKANGGSNYTIFSAPSAGTYDIYVILMNCEASTYDLNISGKLNNVELTKIFNLYNSYQSSGDNRRNYRICKYSVAMDQSESIVITPSSVSEYTTLLAFIAKSNLELEDVTTAKTAPDNTATISGNLSGVFLYGYCTGDGNANIYYLFNENSNSITLTSPDGNHSYGTGFIFNIVV